jgi:hypothetical protein
MHAVDIAYASRRDLCDHVVADDDQLALVIPGPRSSVAEGSPISVRVTASGLPGDAMFDGRTREIRVGSESLLAVVPEAGEQRRLSFLRDWARGAAPTAYRREERLSIARVPAVITLATPAVRRETVQLLDVSERGARISFPEPLARGSLLILEVNTPDGLLSFAASVMWSANASVGLQLCHSFASERAAWANLVASARRSFSERVAASLVPEEPSSEVFEVAPCDMVSFEADEQNESPAATGAYRIVGRRAARSRQVRSEGSADSEGTPQHAEPLADPRECEHDVADDVDDFVIGRIATK